MLVNLIFHINVHFCFGLDGIFALMESCGNEFQADHEDG